MNEKVDTQEYVVAQIMESSKTINKDMKQCKALSFQLFNLAKFIHEFEGALHFDSINEIESTRVVTNDELRNEIINKRNKTGETPNDKTKQLQFGLYNSSISSSC